MTSENKEYSTVSRGACRQVVSFALAAVFCLAGATRASAQTEDALKRFFEGKMVRVKIDMPATHDGIDVYPNKPTPVKWNDVSKRINRHGVSIKKGLGIYLTQVTPRYSMGGCGGLSAQSDRVRSAVRYRGGLSRLPVSNALAGGVPLPTV